MNNYIIYSKNIITSTIFLIPLIILYELFAFFIFNNEIYIIRNAADHILRDLFNFISDSSIVYYSFFIFLFLIYSLISNKTYLSEYKVNLSYLFIMFFEGLVLGLIMLFLLNDKSSIFLKSLYYYEDILLSMYLCLGAGIWEEILFRFILISIFRYSFSYIITSNKINLFISFLISSIIFSTFHYIGTSSYEFTFYSFIIRFIGGYILSLIYYFRGLGISSMSHFSYDFLLITIPII